MEFAGACGHPGFGICLYKKVWPEESNLAERLENAIGDSEDVCYSWHKALVGDLQEMPDYRDCHDFKLRDSDLENIPEEFEDAGKVYSEYITEVRHCVADYTRRYNIEMEYEEATNFVKYTEGQHFSVHADHGFSYSATVSAVGYLNDAYEGGELEFPYLDIRFLPEAGDLLVLPSTFIYAHQSLPVTEGIKYSGVTMFDYNDRNHQNHGAYAEVKSSSVDDENPQVTTAGT